MKLFDTHCHVYLGQFNNDRESVLKDLSEKMEFFIEIGINVINSQEILKMIKNIPNGYTTVGIHPNDEIDLSIDYINIFKELCLNEKVVGIGEIGLDFHYDTPKDYMYEIFRKQINLAIEINKPVVLHIRDAYPETLELIKETGLPKAGGVVHCYSGDWTMARKYLDLGLLIGIDGPVTYKANEVLREVVVKTPIECLIPETDSPFLTPVPLRGKRNSPLNVKYIIEKIAELKGFTSEAASEIMLNNAKSLFNIK